MMRLALALLVVAGCKRGGEPTEVAEEAKPGSARGSEGGFSASLSADLEVRGPTKTGSGSDFFDPNDGGPGSAASGSATAGSGSGSGSAAGSAASGSGSNAVAAGSGSNAVAAGSGSNAGSGSAAPAVAKPVEVAAGSAAKPTDAKPADAKPADAKPADTKPADTKPADTKPADTKTSGAEIEMPVATPKPPIAMTPELKAIKISLLPNWERDTVEPATISLVVNVQSREVKETFKFAYGYEDAKAPQDREAFKKYLADAKILKVTTDRQRGAAWYLEGTDGAGRTAFRLVVVYGGRRLFCGGSSYKENSLGDIRDEVVVQAKKICETVAL